MDLLLPPTDLARLVRYDHETGHVFWRRSEGFGPPAMLYGSRLGGKEPLPPGEIRRGSIEGYPVSVADVVWALVKGHWPRFQLEFIDGNLDNTRIDNLRYKLKVKYGGPGSRQAGTGQEPVGKNHSRIFKLPIPAVNAFFNYEGNGSLSWKVDPSTMFSMKSQEPGDLVETITLESGVKVIQFDRGRLLVHLIVWALHRGEYPPQGLLFVDGDPGNPSIENLEEA